jgi:preprotein translocase subunit SecF
MTVRTRRPLNVLRWFPHACLMSALVIGAGIAMMLHRGVPIGIDFSGGSLLVIEFDRDGVLERDVRQALAPLRGDRIVQRYGPAEARRMLVRIAPDPMAHDESLDAGADRVSDALRRATVGSFEIVDRDLVTAAVGEDLQRQALWTTMAAMMAVATFIGVRYRPSFAWGATWAVLHDVLVTLACVTLAGYELTLHVVAALLITIGYSVNDTIVIFDRVRENMAFRRPGALGPLIELSIGQTLRRTAITSGTTSLAVLSLYVFGGEVLRGFAFTMLAGVVSGTYSSIFIAPGMTVLAARWRRGRRRAAAVESH